MTSYLHSGTSPVRNGFLFTSAVNVFFGGALTTRNGISRSSKQRASKRDFLKERHTQGRRANLRHLRPREQESD